MLFVLMFVWLSASVCVCSVCLSPLVSDGPSVCPCPPVSRGLCVCVSLCFSGLCLPVCLSRTSCVSCLLCPLNVPWRLLLSCVGLGCLVLSCLGLSCLVLSVCHQSVLSLCCVYSSSRSSYVCPLVIPFFLFCVPPFVHGVSCSIFSHANAHKAQKLTLERFTTAAPVLSKEHTARTRDPKYVLG